MREGELRQIGIATERGSLLGPSLLGCDKEKKIKINTKHLVLGNRHLACLWWLLADRI